MPTPNTQNPRILVLSFYYPPDLSAGSFRCDAFIRALRGKLSTGARVEVLTTMPNRYNSYRQEAEAEEDDGTVRIRRFRLPGHASGMVDQSRAFASYARQVRSEVKGRDYDLVFATSSRMFTGWLGAVCARRAGARFYLDIRDIFNDSIADVLRGPGIRLLLPALDRVERYMVRSADRVNLVSEGFLEYFRKRYPRQSFSVHPNGIDEAFLGRKFEPGPSHGRGRRRVLYAGNIGQGQGLHRILPDLAVESAATTEFVVIGDGGARGLLERALAERQVDNVELRPPVQREQLLEHYAGADVLFLHLNDLAAFRRVLPSKLFEYVATGKPILAGVGGVAAEFLRREVPDAGVFGPCDVGAAAMALDNLPMRTAARDDFVLRYRRSRIMDRLTDEFLGTRTPTGSP